MGVNQNQDQEFKVDAGKIQAGVLQEFDRALLEVSKVGTFGNSKYGRSSWMKVPDAETRYLDALWRHLLADNEKDDESGLPHLAHLAWNVLALLQMKLVKYFIPPAYLRKPRDD